MKLRYEGYQPHASGFGWATCNTNLRAALGKYFTLTNGEADVQFTPIMDHDLNPCAPITTTSLGYAFFEYPLGEKAVENAKRHKTLFVGSTWCLDRLEERGITNGKVLIQGVDYDVFKPGERFKDGTIKIFSGGKCEYRKGQDLVAQAFAELCKLDPRVHLVCAWHNPWPKLIHLPVNGWKETQEDIYRAYLVSLGIPENRFTVYPQLTQKELARVMQDTDLGLFPNRCEGGTNLVMMEYLATGNPVVANTGTGHRDIWLAGANIHPIAARFDQNKWVIQDIPDIVSMTNFAIRNRIKHDGPRWTWDAAARVVWEEANAEMRDRNPQQAMSEKETL